MKNLPNRQYSIAVLQWYQGDDLACVISDELSNLGHSPFIFTPLMPVPEGVDIIFTYAPYGKFMPIVEQLAKIPEHSRPVLIHWNTEGVPDLRIPWWIVKGIGAARSGLERLYQHDCNHSLKPLGRPSPLSWIDSRMMRFRYVGDYNAAYAKGVLKVYSDTSAVYAELHNKHGLPTVYAPWGSTPRWYADLGIERDIDVLWIGTRGSKRRSNLIDWVRRELKTYGVEMYVADNVENPFIFGDERTEYLNRAKITLNITRTWYDDNYSRFALAAPNRSLIVSEKMLPHCHYYQPGIHYVESQPEDLAKAILHYLENEDERERIINEGYHLSTEVVTFNNSLRLIMKSTEEIISNHTSQSQYPLEMANI